MIILENYWKQYIVDGTDIDILRIVNDVLEKIFINIFILFYNNKYIINYYKVNIFSRIFFIIIKILFMY